MRFRFGIAAVVAALTISAGAGAMESNRDGGGGKVLTVDQIVANPDAARGLDFTHKAETLVTDPNDRDTPAAGISSAAPASSGVSEATGAALSEGVTSGGETKTGPAGDRVTDGQAGAGTGTVEGATGGTTGGATNPDKRVLVVITVYTDGTTDERPAVQ